MEGQWGCSRRYLNAFTGSTDIPAPQTGTAQICLCAQGSVVQTQLPCVLQPRGSAGTAAAGGAPGPALWAEMGQQRYSPAKGTAQGLLCHVLVRTAAFHAMCFLRKCCTPKQAGVSSKELPLTSSLRTMSPSPSPCAARPPLDHRITES